MVLLAVEVVANTWDVAWKSPGDMELRSASSREEVVPLRGAVGGVLLMGIGGCSDVVTTLRW